jgi:hypothetical protein
MCKTHGGKRQHFDPKRHHSSATTPETQQQLMFILSLLWEELLGCSDRHALKLGWRCSSESNLSKTNSTEMQNIKNLTKDNGKLCEQFMTPIFLYIHNV